MAATASGTVGLRQRDSASSIASSASQPSTNNSTRRRPGLAITPPPHAPFLPPPAITDRPGSRLSREQEWTSDDEETGTLGQETDQTQVGHANNSTHNLPQLTQFNRTDGNDSDEFESEVQVDDAECLAGSISSGLGSPSVPVGPLAPNDTNSPAVNQIQVTQPTPTNSAHTTPSLPKSPQHSTPDSPAYTRHDPATQPQLDSNSHQQSTQCEFSPNPSASTGLGLGLGLTNETIQGHSTLINHFGLGPLAATDRTASPILGRLSGRDFPLAGSTTSSASPALLGTSPTSIMSSTSGIAQAESGSRSSTPASSTVRSPRASGSSGIASSNSSLNIPAEPAVDLSLPNRSEATSGVFVSVASSPLARLAAESGAVAIGPRQRVSRALVPRPIFVPVAEVHTALAF